MMEDDRDFERLSDLWRAQEVTEMRIDVHAIVGRARAMDRRVRLRNALEWAACALLVPYCAVRAVGAGAVLELAGFSAMGLGAIFVAVYLFANGRVGRLPDPDLESIRYVAAYRAGLLAQARLLRSAPLWYLAPLTLGALGLVAHAATELHAAGAGLWPAGLSGALTIAVFCGVAALNLRKARRLREEADSIEIG